MKQKDMSVIFDLLYVVDIISKAWPMYIISKYCTLLLLFIDNKSNNNKAACQH